MMHFIALLLAIGGGIAAKAIANIDIRADSRWYDFIVYMLLTVGLYGSVHGIDRTVLRTDLGRIALAISVGVVAKAALIVGAAYTLGGDFLMALALGISLAQIDPVSVAAALSRDGSAKPIISPRAQNIIRTWCSFDDPVTILMAFVLYRSLGVTGNVDIGTILVELGGNALIIVVGAIISMFVRRVERWRIIEIPALIAILIFSAAMQLMLAPAVLGLFFRPSIERYLGQVTHAALFASAFIVGLFLTAQTQLLLSVAIGCAVFFSHFLVSLPLSIGLPRADRIYLAFAQQSGITAILLVMLFEQIRPNIIAVAVPAIICVNALHLLANTQILARRRHAGVD